MKPVAFKQHGQAVNASVLTNVEDFVSNMNVKHDVQTFSITGNVGIGTESPQEKLSVNGKIRAKEVKVETANWPDYVFDQDYKILGLRELEAYIKVNKHSPEIPSAHTVAKEVIELGNINKLLLKRLRSILYI